MKSGLHVCAPCRDSARGRQRHRIIFRSSGQQHRHHRLRCTPRSRPDQSPRQGRGHSRSRTRLPALARLALQPGASLSCVDGLAAIQGCQAPAKLSVADHSRHPPPAPVTSKPAELRRLSPHRATASQVPKYRCEHDLNPLPRNAATASRRRSNAGTTTIETQWFRIEIGRHQGLRSQAQCSLPKLPNEPNETRSFTKAADSPTRFKAAARPWS